MTPHYGGVGRTLGKVLVYKCMHKCVEFQKMYLCVFSPSTRSQIVRRWQYFLRPEHRSLGKTQEGQRHNAVTSREGKHLVQKSLFPPTPGTKKSYTKVLVSNSVESLSWSPVEALRLWVERPPDFQSPQVRA